MKKIAFIALVAILFVACSKEQRTSRKLDGTWKLTKYKGNGVPEGLNETFTFSKEKKGKGSGTYKYSYGNYSESTPFEYYVIDDNLNITYANGGSVFTINNLERKTKLEIQDQNGDISEYEKE